jgi:hypothetical protein
MNLVANWKLDGDARDSAGGLHGQARGVQFGAGPDGSALFNGVDSRVEDTGQVGISTGRHLINEINDLAAYNGKLYAGVLPKAELWRYDGDWDWTLVRRLVHNPDWLAEDLPTWCRVTCMDVFDGKLYCGTATCEGIAAARPHYELGRVMAFEAGKCVSYDDDLGSGWKHVAAVRARDCLKLYIDGVLVKTSPAFEGAGFDITNESPLLIGAGAQSSFRGAIRDARLYAGPLSDGEVRAIQRS